MHVNCHSDSYICKKGFKNHWQQASQVEIALSVSGVVLANPEKADSRNGSWKSGVFFSKFGVFGKRTRRMHKNRQIRENIRFREFSFFSFQENATPNSEKGEQNLFWDRRSNRPHFGFVCLSDSWLSQNEKLTIHSAVLLQHTSLQLPTQSPQGLRNPSACRHATPSAPCSSNTHLQGFVRAPAPQIVAAAQGGGEHRRGEGSETFLERKWVLRRFRGAFLRRLLFLHYKPSKSWGNLLGKKILSHNRKST